MPGGGPLSATSFVGSRIFADGGERVEDAWGENLHKMVDRRFNHQLVYGIIGEDLPEDSNQVVLDPELTDTDGIPAPKLRYRCSENSANMLKFHVDRCLEAVQAAGAIETHVVHQVRDTGWHLLGTATMGADPRASVVDEWGRTSRCAQSLHLRWLRLSDLRRRQSDRDDHERGAAADETSHCEST